MLALREGGLPLQYLPTAADGGLTARINAVDNALSRDHAHPMGAIVAPRSWPELLAEAGLSEVRSRSFLLDLPAPLADAAPPAPGPHAAPHPGAAREAPEPATTWPGWTSSPIRSAPESVLRRPDVFMLRATTIHTAVRG